MNWEQIEQVNREIKTTELKGKQYAEVKERVIAYRKLYPQGVISTELTFTENYVLCEARATNENNLVIATGHARELLSKAFAVENAETSAIGRALGFMGLGINTAIASKEDMENTESPSGIFDEIPLQQLVEEFRKLYNQQEQVQLLNYYKVTDPSKIDPETLKKVVDHKKYGKEQTNQSKGN